MQIISLMKLSKYLVIKGFIIIMVLQNKKSNFKNNDEKLSELIDFLECLVESYENSSIDLERLGEYDLWESLEQIRNFYHKKLLFDKK